MSTTVGSDNAPSENTLEWAYRIHRSGSHLGVGRSLGRLEPIGRAAPGPLFVGRFPASSDNFENQVTKCTRAARRRAGAGAACSRD